MTGEEFRQAVSDLDLNIAQAGRMLGLNVSTVRRYASGRSPVSPTVERLLKLMQRFDLTWDWRSKHPTFIQRQSVPPSHLEARSRTRLLAVQNEGAVP